MEFTQIYNKIDKYVNKMPIWMILLIILAIIFILISVYKSCNDTSLREGFISDQKEQFVTKKGINLFDDFYVNIYDELFFKEIVNEYEVGSIINLTKPTTESNMLVLGSGTGHMVNSFAKEDINVTGLDESVSMIKYAKNEYPNLKFVQGSPIK